MESDPRVHSKTIRRIEGDSSPVILVGVVHDHPASVSRVTSVVDAVDPETIAVEVPSPMVPVYANDRHRAGGEVAAAITADPSIPVEGIDIPHTGAIRSFIEEFQTRPVDPRTALRTLRSAARMTAHVGAASLSRLGLPGAPSVGQLERGHEYEISHDASPARQADHERAHIRRSTALLDSLEPPPETAFLDAVRERYMADRLASLRQAGPVVCVVGFSHLAGIEERLEEGS